MARFDKREPVAGAKMGNNLYHAKNPDGSRMVSDDGLPIVEQVPHHFYVRKVVGVSGTVIRMPWGTGRVVGNTEDNKYGQRKWEEKLKKGMLLYSECPYSNRSLAPKEGITVCKGTNPDVHGAFWRSIQVNDDKGRAIPGLLKFIEDECCPHIADIIAKRKARHDDAMREADDAFKTSVDRWNEMKEAEAKTEIAKMQGRSMGRSRKSDSAEV